MVTLLFSSGMMWVCLFTAQQLTVKDLKVTRVAQNILDLDGLTSAHG